MNRIFIRIRDIWTGFIQTQTLLPAYKLYSKIDELGFLPKSEKDESDCFYS